MASFISRNSFSKLAEENKVLNWTQLPVDGVIYRIDKIEKNEGQSFTSYVLYIENDRGDKKKVWSPSKLIRDIEGKEKTHTIYFTSLGQTKKDGKSYNNFDLVLEEK